MSLAWPSRERLIKNRFSHETKLKDSEEEISEHTTRLLQVPCPAGGTFRLTSRHLCRWPFIPASSLGICHLRCQNPSAHDQDMEPYRLCSTSGRTRRWKLEETGRSQRWRTWRQTQGQNTWNLEEGPGLVVGFLLWPPAFTSPCPCLLLFQPACSSWEVEAAWADDGNVPPQPPTRVLAPRRPRHTHSHARQLGISWLPKPARGRWLGMQTVGGNDNVHCLD